MADTEHEVLIVGAGPSGLAAALELTRLGVPVTLVDRLTEPHRQTRATGIFPWTLEQLEPSGAAELVVEQALHASGADVHSPDGTIMGGYHLDHVPSRYRYFAAEPQWRTEAILTERLEALGGVVTRGVEVTELAERDGEVRVGVRTPTGGEQTWSARWVLCATGADPTVRHTLHERLEGGDYPARYLVADVAVDLDVDPNRTAVFVGDAGAVGFLVIPDGRRLVVVDGGDPVGAPAPDLEAVRAHLAPRLELPWAVSDLTWSSCFTLHHRVVPRMASRRIFLAGDAAHCSSLYGGFGMNGGIHDALNLAWKLAAVRAGWADESLLSTYQLERHPEALRYVAAANTMHVAILGGADETPATPPLPEDPDEANLLRTMLDVQYPTGPAVAPAAGAAAPGRRFPVPDALARHGRFQLAVGAGVEVPPALRDRWVGVVDGVITAEEPGVATLVRPDGVIGWSGRAGDAAWAELEAHLRQCLRPT